MTSVYLNQAAAKWEEIHLAGDQERATRMMNVMLYAAGYKALADLSQKYDTFTIVREVQK